MDLNGFWWVAIIYFGARFFFTIAGLGKEKK
jgi:hypothetical protein